MDKGHTIKWQINTPDTKGQLIITKGDPKFGKYNFIEVGDWKEFFEDSSGDFIRGKAFVETTFDGRGNILSRTVLGKRKKDNEFHKSEIWTSKMEVFGIDPILTQTIKTFGKGGIQGSEFTLGVLNHKQKLSDRLKAKIKIGKELIFDGEGNVKRERYYRYEDKIKAK